MTLARACAVALLGIAMSASAPAQSQGYSGKRAASVNFKEAERRVQVARVTRERGRQPINAEEAARGPGPNARYEQRQERLDRALAAAERRYLETSMALQAYDRPRAPARISADASATTSIPTPTGQPWPTASPISLTR